MYGVNGYAGTAIDHCQRGISTLLKRLIEQLLSQPLDSLQIDNRFRRLPVDGVVRNPDDVGYRVSAIHDDAFWAIAAR